MRYLYLQMPTENEAGVAEIVQHLKSRGVMCEGFTKQKGVQRYGDYPRDFMAIVFKIRMNGFDWREIFKEFNGAGGEIDGYWEEDISQGNNNVNGSIEP